MKRSLTLLTLVLMLAVGCGRQGGPIPELPASSGPALGEVGNGALGVVSDGKVYLIDLVEAGIERNAKLGNFTEEHNINSFAKQLRAGVRFGEDKGHELFPYEAVGQRLNSLYHGDPVLAMSLLEVIKMYQWNFIDRNLSVLPLKGGIIDFGEGKIVLIANRRGKSIYVSIPVFSKADIENRAATIVHEALYALIAPMRLETPNGPTLTQNVARVREVNGYIFSHHSFGHAEETRRLHDVLGEGEFPTSSVDYQVRVALADCLGQDEDAKLWPHTVLIEPYLFFGIYDTKFPGKTLAEDNNRIRLDENLTPDKETGRIARMVAEARRTPRMRLYFQLESRFKRSAVKLSFASHQEGTEVKTYVKFEWIDGVTVMTAASPKLPRLEFEEAEDENKKAWATELTRETAWLAVMRATPDFAIYTTPEENRSGALRSALSKADQGYLYKQRWQPGFGSRD